MDRPARPALLDTLEKAGVPTAEPAPGAATEPGAGDSGEPLPPGVARPGSAAGAAPSGAGVAEGLPGYPSEARGSSRIPLPGSGTEGGPDRVDFSRLLHLLNAEKILRGFRLGYLAFIYVASLQVGTLVPGVSPAAFGILLVAYFAGTLLFARPRFSTPRAAFWLAWADVVAVTAIFVAGGAHRGFAGPLYLLAFALAGARLPVLHALAVAAGGMVLYTSAAAAVGGAGGVRTLFGLVQQWLVAGGAVFFVAYLAWTEGQQRARKEEVERLLGDLRDSHLRLREYALLADRMAYQDALTGLYNFRFFQEVLPQEIQREQAYSRPVSLLMLDIDHFKRYNDRCGHTAGNEVLQTVAELLRQATRSRDVVCRFGGEEFAVILPGAGADIAQKVAERIRATVEGHDFPGGRDQPGGRLTVSVGAATFPRDAKNPEELVERADAALYAAKGSGRNRTRSAASRWVQAG